MSMNSQCALGDWIWFRRSRSRSAGESLQSANEYSRCLEVNFLNSSAIKELLLVSGDRVAVEPNLTCHVCEFCKRGTYNLCPEIDLTAVSPYKGQLRRYAIMKGDLVFK